MIWIWRARDSDSDCALVEPSSDSDAFVEAGSVHKTRGPGKIKTDGEPFIAAVFVDSECSGSLKPHESE